jgi:hypothetical protein
MVRTPRFKAWFGDWELDGNSISFDQELDKYKNGTLPSGEILDLGLPSQLLQEHGIPNLPIRLTQKILKKAVNKHKVELSDLSGLLKHIHAPIAILRDKDIPQNRILVTEIRHKDGNIVVAVHVDVQRSFVEINDVRSIFPKNDKNAGKWIDEGLLLAMDRSKGNKWIQTTPSTPNREKALNALADSNLYNAEELVKSSKVVDANGEPLVVYHGTDADIETFIPDNAQGWGTGVYFASNKQVTEEFGDKTLEAYLNIQNPYIDNETRLDWEAVLKTEVVQNKNKEYQSEFDPSGDKELFLDEYDLRDRFAEDGSFLNDVLRELGYNGIIAEGSNNIAGLEIVAFNPNQIKSIYNTGEFGRSGDIRYSKADSPKFSVGEASTVNEAEQPFKVF